MFVIICIYISIYVCIYIYTYAYKSIYIKVLTGQEVAKLDADISSKGAEIRAMKAAGQPKSAWQAEAGKNMENIWEIYGYIMGYEWGYDPSPYPTVSSNMAGWNIPELNGGV